MVCGEDLLIYLFALRKSQAAFLFYLFDISKRLLV